MTKSERSTYKTLDFAAWSEAKTLVLTPKFQRRTVWTAGARSFFIDTLIREMPVPPIFLRIRQSDDKKKIVREVVDGQQRLSSALSFTRDEFKLSKSLDKRWANKRFSELDEAFKDNINNFSFICEVFQGISDGEILEIFARLNQYSVPLNAQELRNGKYFGFFKQAAYRLAYLYVDFWRKHKLFSERAMARMNEVEFTSELIIALIDGLQDKKKSISNFYSKYDESFPNEKRIVAHFKDTLDTIESLVGDTLNETAFTRPPLFYTLFCAVYHRTYKLPKVSAPVPSGPISTNEGHDLAEAMGRLSEVLASAREQEPYPESTRSSSVRASDRPTTFRTEPRDYRSYVERPFEKA